MVGRRLKQLAAGGAVAVMVLIGTGLAYSRATGAQLLSVQSGSMVPALHKGDLVTVTRVPSSQLAVGDVITFMNPQGKKTITHRIVALPSTQNGNHIVTKGDANAAADAPISAGAVLGRVGHNVPFAGYASDIIRQPIGLLLCIYIPALAIVADELRRLTAYYKKQRIYLAPGRQLRRFKAPRKQSLAMGTKTLAACLVIAVTVTVPARAALNTNATLAGNSISSAPITPFSHIMFREVAFECSRDNTAVVNKLPGILFHNPGTADVSTGNWYVQSSQGRLVTFRPQTVFDARDDYDIEPDLKTGVNYAGDYLALYDGAGVLVDAISWGTDTTYLSPSLPGSHAGTVFRRMQLVTDTNSIIDWAVSVRPCQE